MIQKPYSIIPLFLLLLLSCGHDDNAFSDVDNKNKNEKSSDENSELYKKSIDTNGIIDLITLYEFIKREQNREAYSLEKLHQLKDSINYDSIMLNRDLPTFEKSE